MCEFCTDCKKDTKTIMLTRDDCNMCRGTGIGHHADAKCGQCKGRGYMIVEPYPVCEECELPREE